LANPFSVEGVEAAESAAKTGVDGGSMPSFIALLVLMMFS
jgi:hypothetical protein